MKKLFLSLLLAAIACSMPTPLQSINHPLKKHSLLKKLLYNPTYLYEYSTESGDTIIIDPQKMLLLASATSYHRASMYPMLQSPWIFYSTAVEYGITIPSSLMMVFKDYKIGFAHLIALYAITKSSAVLEPHYGPTLASASLYILQSLYTGTWFPLTYKTQTKLIDRTSPEKTTLTNI